MVYWAFQGRSICEVTDASFEQGIEVFGRYQIKLTLKLLATSGALDGNSWAIIPTAADVTLYNPTHGEMRFLGHFRADGDTRFTSGTQKTDATFVCELSGGQLAAVEDWRKGRDVMFTVRPVARATVANNPVELSLENVGTFFREARSKWDDLLEAIGFLEHLTVSIPVRVADDARLDGAGTNLREGIAALQEGRDADAIAACRLAVEALGSVGFGGKAPEDVHKFITERAKSMSIAERVAAARAGLLLFLHAGHHDDPQRASLNRIDAIFAIAATAALARIAPQRLLSKPPDTDDG